MRLLIQRRAAGRLLAIRNARIGVDRAIIAAHRIVVRTAGTRNGVGPKTPVGAGRTLVGVELTAADDGVPDIATDAHKIRALRMASACRKAPVGVDLAVRARAHRIEVETAPANFCIARNRTIAMLQMRGDSMDVDRDGGALVADLDQLLIC